MESGSVAQEIAAGVGTIIFSHPRSNSLPGALLREVAKAVEEFGSHPLVNVIVLLSRGDKAFCAGASFDELLALRSEEESRYFFSGFALLIAAIRRVPKLVIARVQGKAVGGGVGVVASADYAIAHESASLRLSELALGIGPFIIGPAVQRKIGVAAFSSMAIDADWRSASWGLSHGLYAEVCSSLEELDAKVAQLAAKLASCNPEAMSKLKSVLWEGTENWEELLPRRVSITGTLALTDFVQKAITEVNNK